jgi:hypothetical protein
MKKYMPIVLAVAAFATVGAAPALARTIHSPAQSSGQSYMYVPGGSAATPYVTPSRAEPYPNPIGRSGTQENRSEWDPNYTPGAPG